MLCAKNYRSWPMFYSYSKNRSGTFLLRHGGVLYPRRFDGSVRGRNGMHRSANVACRLHCTRSKMIDERLDMRGGIPLPVRLIDNRRLPQQICLYAVSGLLVTGMDVAAC